MGLHHYLRVNQNTRQYQPSGVSHIIWQHQRIWANHWKEQYHCLRVSHNIPFKRINIVDSNTLLEWASRWDSNKNCKRAITKDSYRGMKRIIKRDSSKDVEWTINSDSNIDSEWVKRLDSNSTRKRITESDSDIKAEWVKQFESTIRQNEPRAVIVSFIKSES